MKRTWKISELTRSEILRLHGCSARPRNPTLFLFALNKSPSHGLNLNTLSSSSSSDSSSWCSNVIRLFTEKLAPQTHTLMEDLAEEFAQLRYVLTRNCHDSDKVARILDEKRVFLLQRYADGSAIIELLKELDSNRRLALQVFEWRRKQEDAEFPMTAEEYAKGITLAGKVKNIDLAVELFSEAANKQLKTTSTYNALMTAYMVNGYFDDCQLLFRHLKKEAECSPTIVTYNILISVFGRLVLLDHMETTLREIKALNLTPNLNTYNNLIAGYLTAWMWDDMERTFQLMKEGSVKPDTSTYLLMLRGYGHSGNLEKMEQMYELIKDDSTQKHIPLIRVMICAYCKSSSRERVKRIEALMRHLSEEDYRPWLIVLLIRIYAEEDWLEAMEESINMAFKHNTTVHSLHVMKSITATYFRCKAVDRLSTFVKRAESAGWRICRSLYHCKMVMFALERRFEEMESVLNEMENSNLDRTKKTFWILFRAYLLCGQRNKAAQVIGLMCKHGYEIPRDVLPA